MSKIPSNLTMPIYGQPVFVISENPLEERVQLIGGMGSLNSLVYFAHEAILVKALTYDPKFPEDLTKVIINQGMTIEGTDKSAEIRLDLVKNFEKDSNALTVFVKEEDAAAMAAKLNANQKAQCKKLVDIITKAFNAYDEIIASCKAR